MPRPPPADLVAILTSPRSSRWPEAVQALTAMEVAPPELWPTLLEALRDPHYTFAIEDLLVRTGAGVARTVATDLELAPRSEPTALAMASRLRVLAHLEGRAHEALFRRALGSRRAWIRAAAIEALGRLDRADAEALGLAAYGEAARARAADPSQGQLAFALAFALARVGTERAIDAALDFERTFGGVDLVYGRPLRQIGARDLGTLLARARSELAEARASAAGDPGASTTPEADIARATRRPLEGFPVTATLEVIHHLGDFVARPDVREHLVSLLAFPNHLARREAATVLLRSGDAHALARVADLAPETPLLAKVIAAAARALGGAASAQRAAPLVASYRAARREDPAASPPAALDEALRGLSPSDAEAWFEVVAGLLPVDPTRAVAALARLGDARGRAIVEGAIDEHTASGRAAIIALGAFAARPDGAQALARLATLGAKSQVRDAIVAAVHGLRAAGKAAAGALAAVAARADLDNFTRLLARDSLRQVERE